MISGSQPHTEWLLLPSIGSPGCDVISSEIRSVRTGNIVCSLISSVFIPINILLLAFLATFSLASVGCSNLKMRFSLAPHSSHYTSANYLGKAAFFKVLF
ncbi:hypothetical protein NPIL_420381 [Nephila pilipes]|uniref:Uncharacterized protein n=1 Tax=Nephila pilipes TaxID=299642 RepID=A0A8X6MJZ4_NEPPI|nr:hypothetical protein NPIL_420381 [Nephila pilipes]